jgi:hypothetical protein
MLWRVRYSRVLVASAILFVSAGCGATPQVAGDWSGRVAPAHFDYLELRLTQKGKVIRGTACYEVVPGSSAGGVVFRDATVTGVYPTIQVTAANYNGWTFVGEFQDDGRLDGQWRSSTSSNYPMSLTRGLAGTPGCL